MGISVHKIKFLSEDMLVCIAAEDPYHRRNTIFLYDIETKNKHDLFCDYQPVSVAVSLLSGISFDEIWYEYISHDRQQFVVVCEKSIRLYCSHDHQLTKTFRPCYQFVENYTGEYPMVAYTQDDRRILISTPRGIFQASVEGDLFNQITYDPLAGDKIVDIGNDKLVCTI